MTTCCANGSLFLTSRHATVLRENTSLPPKDELVQYLLKSTNDEYPKCSNCDRNEKSAMFYCNTCGKIYDNEVTVAVYYIAIVSMLIGLE